MIGLLDQILLCVTTAQVFTLICKCSTAAFIVAKHSCTNKEENLTCTQQDYYDLQYGTLLQVLHLYTEVQHCAFVSLKYHLVPTQLLYYLYVHM